MAFILAVFIIFAIAAAVHLLLCLLVAVPFAWAWNACLVPLFQQHEMTFTSAFALLLIISVLAWVIQGVRISAELTRREFIER